MRAAAAQHFSWFFMGFSMGTLVGTGSELGLGASPKASEFHMSSVSSMSQIRIGHGDSG